VGALITRHQHGLTDWECSNTPDDDSDFAATLFNDMTSNVTFLMGQGIGGASTDHKQLVGTGAYFEGTNIIVYIKGREDDNGNWWRTDSARGTRRNENGLTLVNAHYDS